jgi:hypothetical protein
LRLTRRSVRRTRLEILYHVRDARARNPRKHGETCVAVMRERSGSGGLVKVMAISNAPCGYIRVFVWRIVYSQKTRPESGLDAFVHLVRLQIDRKRFSNTMRQAASASPKAKEGAVLFVVPAGRSRDMRKSRLAAQLAPACRDGAERTQRWRGFANISPPPTAT